MYNILYKAFIQNEINTYISELINAFRTDVKLQTFMNNTNQSSSQSNS